MFDIEVSCVFGETFSFGYDLSYIIYTLNE